eukprot:157583-Chlamydomonas_euryale.AAC.3
MDLLIRRRMLVAAGRMRERENNANVALRVGSDARLESWEHSERGQDFSQRSNAVRVRKAVSEPRSAFPVEYRRAFFGVDDPFTRRKCFVEWGPLLPHPDAAATHSHCRHTQTLPPHVALAATRTRTHLRLKARHVAHA